jgi:hypothetical protein
MIFTAVFAFEFVVKIMAFRFKVSRSAVAWHACPGKQLPSHVISPLASSTSQIFTAIFFIFQVDYVQVMGFYFMSWTLKQNFTQRSKN